MTMLNPKPVRTAKPSPAEVGEAENQDAAQSTNDDQYLSRAVAKALEVLELLQAAEARPLSMAEIGQHIQLSKTSSLRVLRTLESMGCVTPDGRGHYVLAAGISSVPVTQWIGRLHRAGLPHLQALGREFAETTTLAALLENRIEAIAVVESPHVIRMSSVVGHLLAPNASALGKAITAFQPLEGQEKLLRSFGTYRFTSNTIVDRVDLNREYEDVRLQKYAVDREECAYDGLCFSAPVSLSDGRVLAAISVSMPKTRLRDAAHEQTIIAGVRATAERLAAALDAG